MTRTWDRVLELMDLQDGWLDGAGLAPATGALLDAGRLADALHPDVIRIYPTPEGGAQLEWDDANLTHSITISPDRRLHLMTVDKDDTP